MKLKPGWLDQLSSAARQACDDTPESLARTEARVLGALREPLEAKRSPWSLALFWSAVCAVIAVLLDLPPWVSQAPPENRADLVVRLLFEDEVWSTPTDALLADSSGADPAVEDLSREINRLLQP
jgi:hypothetical protein